MVPQGWADVVGVGLLHTPKESGHLCLHRSPGAVWVEPAEWHLLETLAPHLQRAAAIHELLARTRATTGSLGMAVAAAGLGAQIQHFGARFGLTLAETRVLGEIIGANGLLAAATRLKITKATARTHAKHVLAKTETNRQTELIRRFFGAALPGSPGGA